MTQLTASDLVVRFFDEARSAVDHAAPQIDLDESAIVKIAKDPAARARFRDEFRKLNNPDLRYLIEDYLADVVIDLEGASERSVTNVELVDRAALAVAAPVTVSGLVALTGITTVAAAMGPFLLAGGLAGLAVSGVGRTLLRRSVLSHKMNASKVKQLKDSLK